MIWGVNIADQAAEATRSRDWPSAVAIHSRGRPTADVAGRRQRGRRWTLALPPLATLTVVLAGIGSASFWRDEAATLTATRRSLPELLRMLRHVDAVHGTYYLMMWPVVHLFGTSEFVMRFPSAVAMTMAAFGVALIGRRLGSWPTGLLAGLVFATLPMTSRYGQEARSYALVTAVAVLASYLLIRLIEEPGRRWLIPYGAALTALGLLNFFALLIIPAHAVSLTAWRRRAARSGTGRGWPVAAAAACAAVLPIAALAWSERQQLAWLMRPRLADVFALVTMITGSGAAFLLVAALCIAGATDRDRHGAGATDRGQRGAGTTDRGQRGRTGRAAGRSAIWLAGPWLVMPVCLLMSVSEIKPVYVDRYVVFCLPAVALLAGAGLTIQGKYWRIAALSMLVLLALPMQHAIRQPWGHGDDIKAAARLLRVLARPGDAVVYRKPGARDIGAGYRYGFTKLRDVGLAKSAVAAGNLSGTEIPVATIERRLRTAERVWVVHVGYAPAGPMLVRPARFRLIGKWFVNDIALRLYEKRGDGNLHHGKSAEWDGTSREPDGASREPDGAGREATMRLMTWIVWPGPPEQRRPAGPAFGEPPPPVPCRLGCAVMAPTR